MKFVTLILMFLTILPFHVFAESTQESYLSGGMITSVNHHFSFGLTCEDELDHPSMCINHIRIGSQAHDLSISKNQLDLNDIKFKRELIKLLECELLMQNESTYTQKSQNSFFSSAAKFYLMRKKIKKDGLAQEIVNHLIEGKEEMELPSKQFISLYYALDAKSYSNKCSLKELYPNKEN